MNKIILNIILTLLTNIIFCQETSSQKLKKIAHEYYNKKDYSNSIILFEDLLAEQELIYDPNNIHIAQTLIKLGELYSLINMPKESKYYFKEALAYNPWVYQTTRYVYPDQSK